MTMFRILIFLGLLTASTGCASDRVFPDAPRYPVCINDLCGYINRDGTIAIDLQYDHAEPFSEGLAAVRTEGYYGYIDASGGERITR